MCVTLFTSTRHTSSHTEERFTTGGENERRPGVTSEIGDTMNDHTATHGAITVAGKCLGVRVVKCIQAIVAKTTAPVNVPNNL